jgi:hypothetical protein
MGRRQMPSIEPKGIQAKPVRSFSSIPKRKLLEISTINFVTPNKIV